LQFNRRIRALQYQLAPGNDYGRTADSYSFDVPGAAADLRENTAGTIDEIALFYHKRVDIIHGVVECSVVNQIA
jgi:hypothetical protein